MLLEAGYNSSFTLGLIINSSDIAFLIPPSIGFIVYGVATSTSIGMLFLAGVFPGLLILVMFSIYCYFYSKVKKVGVLPKASWSERMAAIKDGLPVMGFPVIIVGGIYGGLLQPDGSRRRLGVLCPDSGNHCLQEPDIRANCGCVFANRCDHRAWSSFWSAPARHFPG